jgi:hypothetical protein
LPYKSILPSQAKFLPKRVAFIGQNNIHLFPFSKFCPIKRQKLSGKKGIFKNCPIKRQIPLGKNIALSILPYKKKRKGI